MVKLDSYYLQVFIGKICSLFLTGKIIV